MAAGMQVRVVPGQTLYRWCARCAEFAALEVGVYAGPAQSDLIGTYIACDRCDPDLFTDDQKEVGGG